MFMLTEQFKLNVEGDVQVIDSELNASISEVMEEQQNVVYI